MCGQCEIPVAMRFSRAINTSVLQIQRIPNVIFLVSGRRCHVNPMLCQPKPNALCVVHAALSSLGWRRAIGINRVRRATDRRLRRTDEVGAIAIPVSVVFTVITFGLLLFGEATTSRLAKELSYRMVAVQLWRNWTPDACRKCLCSKSLWFPGSGYGNR
jgi:hypothetical protein